MSLTTEQALMQEVVNRIADKYTTGQTDRLVEDAEKITSAILSYTNNDKEEQKEAVMLPKGDAQTITLN